MYNKNAYPYTLHTIPKITTSAYFWYGMHLTKIGRAITYTPIATNMYLQLTYYQEYKHVIDTLDNIQ